MQRVVKQGSWYEEKTRNPIFDLLLFIAGGLIENILREIFDVREAKQETSDIKPQVGHLGKHQETYPMIFQSKNQHH